MRALKLWLRRHLPTALYHRLKYGSKTAVVDRVSRGRVLGGPFKGMVFKPHRAFNGHYGMLLGVYELDTHPVINKLALQEGDNVAIIGAAEGYFAVGLARKYPGIRVQAFELETWAHTILEAVADQNGVAGRIDVFGAASIELLKQVFTEHPPRFVHMDVEGAEAFLADPEALPALQTAELLVELHPMEVPGIKTKLQERFASTHTQTIIRETPRKPEEVMQHFSLQDFKKVAVHYAALTDENRVEPMEWLHVVPKVHPAS